MSETMIIDNDSRATDAVQAIKHAFFACRNGVVADALRRAGDPHRYIMGCQLTDVASIVSQFSRLSQPSRLSRDSRPSPVSHRLQPDSCQSGHALSASARLPQLSQPSQPSQPSRVSFFARLAQALWNNAEHRECRLAATMLYPPDELSHKMALEWARGAETTEVADVLCHRLLRHLDFASQLVVDLLADDEQFLVRYTAFRLLLNLLISGREQSAPTWRTMLYAEMQRDEPRLRPLLDRLDEELNTQ